MNAITKSARRPVKCAPAPLRFACDYCAGSFMTPDGFGVFYPCPECCPSGEVPTPDVGAEMAEFEGFIGEAGDGFGE